ncbi:hypothetical protein [Streptomyces coerulescens]|uniref:Uncharacterized protein n=1 Tax=Streptomyces coerulescens TaxID=29304 RepID=A0ABW0CXS1_STRCD
MTTPNRFQMAFDGRARSVVVEDVIGSIAAVDVHAEPYGPPLVVPQLASD